MNGWSYSFADYSFSAYELKGEEAYAKTYIGTVKMGGGGGVGAAVITKICGYFGFLFS